MSPVGRNDPCPCGSGKKYKKCCLGKAEAAGAYTAAERQAALDGLFRFAASGRLEEELADSELAFWGDLRTPREAAGLKSARPRVISLLKAMENMAERDRREGRPAYDFGWMWAELGLDRPG